MYARTHRILAWLALFLSIGVAVTALLAIDARRTDDDLSLAPPSPTAIGLPSILPSPPSTEVPSATEGTLDTSSTPAKTEPIVPSLTAETEATPTLEPPATPSPTPVIETPEPSPLIRNDESTPVTGASSVPAGVMVMCAGIAFAVVLRRSY